MTGEMPDKSPEDPAALFAEAVRLLGARLEEKPVIMVVGTLGFGKSTTINALFGEKVAHTDDLRRGTSTDVEYDWKPNDQHITLIDLPGLGDSPELDEKYLPVYRERLKQAHAVLFVITPPRPAGYGTFATIDVILKSGFPASAIIFGFNKLHMLEAEDGSNVVIDGKLGIVRPLHRAKVDQAKAVFLSDIVAHAPDARFTSSQVVAYDAKNGWNCFGLVHEAFRHVPWTALKNWRKATKEAEMRQAALAKENRDMRASLSEYRNDVAYKLLDGMEDWLRTNGHTHVANGVARAKEHVARAVATLAKGVESLLDAAAGFVEGLFSFLR